MNNNDDDPTTPENQRDEEQLALDPDTLGHPEPASSTPSTPDFYEEEEYVDWDEPDRDTSTGGSLAVDEAPEYFDVDEDDYPPVEDNYPLPGDYVEEEEGGDEDEPAAAEEGIDEVPAAIYTEQEASYPTEETTAATDEEEEEDLEVEDFDDDRRLPIGMLAVGAVALILLAIGGYGVMQERSELEEEVRQLQAGLATRADPDELLVAGDQVAVLERENRELKAEVEELSGEYRQLSGTVASLQTQLKEQRAQIQEKQQPAAPEPAAAPEPITAAETATSPEPATPPEVVTAQPVVSGDWFVNFGAYSLQETATNWSKRLQPGAGEVIVVPVEAGGKNLYRVRVIGLANKDEAAAVARELEQAHGVDKLWVGRAS